MKATALLFVLASAACHTSASAPDRAVQTIGAASVPSARYRTFAFGLAEPPAAPYALSERSFEVERHLEPFIVAELTKKGYALSEGSADFLVRFSAGNAEVPIPQPGETEGNGGPTEYAHVGELVIDAFDGSSRAQVWHGTAEARINPQGINERQLQAAVQQMLARFPARSDDTDRGGATDRQPQ
jgi:Domain of unknown function (DUF4136)